MFLGISCALLLANGYLSARLLSLHSFWEKRIGAFILALAQMIVLSLTVGMFPGGYRPLPLTTAAAAIFIILLIVCYQKGCLVKIHVDKDDKSYIKPFILVIIVTLPIWLWEFFNGILLPPMYWDSFLYHLIGPAIWARDGYIHFFATNNPFVAGYPANFELISGWTMAMTGTDIWAELVGLPFVFLGIAVIFAFSHNFGVSSWNSFWAGLLFAATPMVIFHSKAAYIDLSLSVVFSIAFYFLYLYAKDGQFKHLYMGAIAMGLIVGAKYSGAYLAIIGLIPIIYRIYQYRNRLYQPSWLRIIASYVILILLFGSFFYIRNGIMFGNPVHPMKLVILGVTIFDGQYLTDAFNFTTENSWITLVKSILDTEPSPMMDSYHAGFGPQMLLLAIPAIIYFLLEDRKRRLPIIVLWLIPTLLSVAVLPAKYPRYLIYLNIILLPFVAWMFDNLSRWSARLLKLLAVACVLYSIIISTPMYILVPQEYEAASNSVWNTTQVGLGRYHYYINDFNNIRGGPLRIATGFISTAYSLLGEHWQNELIVLPTDNEEEWLQELRNRRVDLFVVERGLSFPEPEWIARHPETFRLVNSDPDHPVYLVIPGDRAHQDFVEKLVDSGVLNI